MPTGNDPQTVQAYYDALLSKRLESVGADAVRLDLTSLAWAALFAFVLIGFFFLYTWSFRRVHRSQGDLYGATRFGGAMLERIGRASKLSWAAWIGTVLYAAYFFVDHLLRGQYY